MSCINRQVGKSPVEPGFADVTGRPQWAIPWMEDDPNMISPQLWAGRMRRDAFDALRYGCTGLMGIHWRTRVLGPNVAALAQAAWDQSEWGGEAGLKHNPPCSEGVMGGNIAVFANHPIEGTEDDPVYQAVRYNLTGYRIAVPNGAYTVTLKFCEPHYSAKGKRAFGVKIEGKRVLDKLDIFEKVGQNKVFDRVYKNVEVDDGQLAIDFMDQVEFPCIAGVVVEGLAATRKINCGGPTYKDFEADLPACPTPLRSLPADDFYADWARTQFGADVGGEIGTLFARLDGQLVEPATWVKGPGGIHPDTRTWDEAVKPYAFVEEFAAFRSRVHGAGSLERFDYWLDSFRYMRATARTRVTWGRYNGVMTTIAAEQDVEAKRRLAREQALPIRRELIGHLEDVYRYLLGTVKTSGEMGTVTNWEQHIMPVLLTKPGQQLADILGEPLPADAELPTQYTGPTRIIVPTVRTSLDQGESLRLTVIILATEPPTRTLLQWRKLGQEQWSTTRLTHVARGVYSAEFTADADFEYHVEVTTADGDPLRFPATGTKINQTVIVVPDGR